MYGIRMDSEVAKQVTAANEAAVTLVTLLVSRSDLDAIDTAMTEEAYTEPGTCMAIASLASSAIRTIAELLECDPMEVMQAAGLSAAEMNVEVQRLADEGL